MFISSILAVYILGFLIFEHFFLFHILLVHQFCLRRVRLQVYFLVAFFVRLPHIHLKLAYIRHLIINRCVNNTICKTYISVNLEQKNTNPDFRTKLSPAYISSLGSFSGCGLSLIERVFGS